MLLDNYLNKKLNSFVHLKLISLYKHSERKQAILYI